MKLNLLCLLLNSAILSAAPHPISFSIPESKIVAAIPPKSRDFAFIDPRKLDTYIYTQEEDYYKDYQRSYFAITLKKGGWDCMRHYEILANGCVPYFIGYEKRPPGTMEIFPWDLIIEAMHMEGVSESGIDHTRFDVEKYKKIADKLLQFTREHLTARKMAEYLLDTIHYSGSGKILCISNDTGPQYWRSPIWIGLKQILGAERVIDYPKIPSIYTSFPQAMVGRLYGKGFTVTRIIEDSLYVDRENIEERIRNKEFDLVIFGDMHRGTRCFDLVREVYEPERIVYICGEDEDWHYVQTKEKHSRCQYHNELQNFFLRDFGFD